MTGEQLMEVIRVEIMRQIYYAAVNDGDSIQIDGAGGWIDLDLKELAEAIERMSPP